MIVRLTKLSILIAVILLSLLYFFYPATVYHFYPGCALYKITGYYCPACGSQRAFSELLHGHLQLAARDNFLFVAAIFFLIIFFFKNSYNILSKREFNIRQKPSDLFLWMVLVLILVFGIVRNIPFEPFSYLAPITS